MPATGYSQPSGRRQAAFGSGRLQLDAARGRLCGSGIYPLPNSFMLWSYKLNFTGMFDGPADIAEARKLLAEKMRHDPHAYIGSLSPMEPSCKTVGELVKKVFTGG